MFNMIEQIKFLKFSPLWTDCFLYLLLAIIFFVFFSIRNNPILLEPWKRVVQKPLNIFVMMLLGVFVLITTLDSIHFEVLPNHPVAKSHPNTYGSGKTKSVLDLLLKESIEHQETSYSAPFSLYGFNKENQIKKGLLIRDYPRLLYSGHHLQHESLRSKDILSKVGWTAFFSLNIWVGLLGMRIIFCQIKRKKPPQSTNSKFPKKTFWLTLYLILFMMVFVNMVTPYYHIMGTSKIGNDVLYEAIKSIRTGVLIGALTTLVMLPVAIFLGILSGYMRGWLDDIIQYTYTTLSSIPGVLLIAASVLSLQILMTTHNNWFSSMAERSDARLLSLCLILGLTSWTGLCRLLRAEALKLREIDYVMAARSLGVSHFKIMFKHLLPNMSHIILISIALDFSGLVLAEAVLSYIGIGVDPASYSWGTMINGARLEMSREPVVWWSLVAAFIFMFTLVLSANIFSDSLRDVFDPRMRDQK